MSALKREAESGDTESPVRAGHSGSPVRREQTGCQLEPKCQDLNNRSCGACLREAVEDARREGLRDKLDLAVHCRQQFWLDTCRDPLQMRSPSRQALELHRQYGCRFSAPTSQQIQYVLDALDIALPQWDCGHAELFYQTLELNFPDVVRVRPAQYRG